MSLGSGTSAKKRWSDRENRYISAHRADGYELISEGLAAFGCERSPDAVKKHALRSLGIKLRRDPEHGMRKCIECGRWDARPSTRSGRAGFCPACWEKRKSAAYAEATDEMMAGKLYEREKKRRKDFIKKEKGRRGRR